MKKLFILLYLLIVGCSSNTPKIEIGSTTVDDKKPIVKKVKNTNIQLLNKDGIELSAYLVKEGNIEPKENGQTFELKPNIYRINLTNHNNHDACVLMNIGLFELDFITKYSNPMDIKGNSVVTLGYLKEKIYKWKMGNKGGEEQTFVFKTGDYYSKIIGFDVVFEEECINVNVSSDGNKLVVKEE